MFLAERRKKGREKKEGAQAAQPDLRWIFALIVAVCLALIAYYAVMGSSPASPPPAKPSSNASNQSIGAVIIELQNAPTKGGAQPVVWLVEFGDFQCPHSARASQVVEQLLADFPGTLGVVWKNFPLDSSCNPLVQQQIHPEACKAAEASACAFEQGRFWEYHDVLFRNQGALDVTSLKKYAGQVGLDEKMFVQCLDSGSKAPEINVDIQEAIALDVPGNPTFFIQGREFAQWSDYGALKAAVQKAVEEASNATTGAP